jgi:hypothetical protein
LVGCGGKVAVDSGGEPVHACASTCRAALEDGGEPCSGNGSHPDRYANLESCACSSDTCEAACASELCASEPVNFDGGNVSDCLHCMLTKCSDTYNQCVDVPTGG